MPPPPLLSVPSLLNINLSSSSVPSQRILDSLLSDIRDGKKLKKASEQKLSEKKEDKSKKKGMGICGMMNLVQLAAARSFFFGCFVCC